MAIMMTDLDFETVDSSLQDVTGGPDSHAIIEFCSMMTRRLGVLAGIAPQDLPESVLVELPPILAG